MANLKQRVVEGFAWRGFVDAANQVLLVAFTAVLARLLTKADFGLVAMAMMAVHLVQTLTGIGIGSAIIQNQKVTEAQVSALFFFQVFVNFLMSLVGFLSAPLVAAFFKQPDLAPVVRVMAWLILVNSLGFPNVILQKALRFRGFSILELGAMVLGNTVGIVLAFSGFGVWSLVFRLLVQRLTYTAGIWPIAGWRPVRPDFHGTGKIFQFGMNILGANIVAYFSQNLAGIVIGRFIGVETLGSYNIAYNLAIVPATKVQSVFTSVLSPMFAKFQQDLSELKRKFFSSAFSLGLLYIPLMLGLSAVASRLVIIMYGEKWREAGLFLTFFALIGLFEGLGHLLRSIIWARGRAGAIFGILLAQTALSVPLLAVGALYFRVVGIILASLAGSILEIILTVILTQRALMDQRVFLRAVWRSLLAATIMYALVSMISVLVPGPAWFVLGLEIGFGALCYSVCRFLLLTPEEWAVVTTWPWVGRLALTRKVRSWHVAR